jgi:hypothetical protein
MDQSDSCPKHQIQTTIFKKKLRDESKEWRILPSRYQIFLICLEKPENRHEKNGIVSSHSWLGNKTAITTVLHSFITRLIAVIAVKTFFFFFL